MKWTLRLAHWQVYLLCWLSRQCCLCPTRRTESVPLLPRYCFWVHASSCFFWDAGHKLCNGSTRTARAFRGWFPLWWADSGRHPRNSPLTLQFLLLPLSPCSWCRPSHRDWQGLWPRQVLPVSPASVLVPHSTTTYSPVWHWLLQRKVLPRQCPPPCPGLSAFLFDL